MRELSRGWDELSPESTYLQDTYARRNTISDAISIAENLGFRLLRTLSRSDLREMLEAGDTAGISSNVQQSLRRADLVIAAADEDGATHYIAVAAAYTADDRDTDRALRNAGFLTRFTGCPAHAAIASIRNDDRIQHLIDSGQIHWHQMEDRLRLEEC